MGGGREAPRQGPGLQRPDAPKKAQGPLGRPAPPLASFWVVPPRGGSSCQGTRRVRTLLGGGGGRFLQLRSV